MLEGIKRWLSGSGTEGKAGGEEVGAWAAQRQWLVRTPRDSEGLIIDGKQGDHPWRLEWGPSQRPYVQGSELRIRADIGLPSDLQMLVLNKPLQEAMEKAVFDQYVEGVQTRIDTETPPEMRWLVMFPKLSGSELGALRERYAAVASAKPWLQQWLEGGLAQALLAVKADAATPLVLMVGRGRITLRTEMPDADPHEFDAMLKLFDAALKQLRRVAAQAGPPAAA